MNSSPKTVGVLYLGEMGASLASVLIARGLRVVTTAQGRSDATARRCRAVGCAVLDSFADVAAQSDVVFSVVPPSAAEEIVEAYCLEAHRAPADALFVDLNSIGPELAMTLAERVSSSGRGFVDGAINGLAKNLTTSATIFQSGPRASEVADLFGEQVRVRLLDHEFGRASAMKMLLSGLSKGVCALFAETALTAHRRGMLNEMIAAYEQIYPGIMTLIQRMFPTYSQHASRRATEMRELVETARASGVEPIALEGARELHDALAAIDYNALDTATVQSLVEFLANEGFLASLATVGGGQRSSTQSQDVL
jgi:3-hydroxyisobutyrate dehydrogenase-like beta-hydroxyacid dehydrogenase